VQTNLSWYCYQLGQKAVDRTPDGGKKGGKGSTEREEHSGSLPRVGRDCNTRTDLGYSNSGEISQCPTLGGPVLLKTRVCP